VLLNCLVLVVGGIPIAMPTVLSVTLAIGAVRLSKRHAIVSRLTAVEEVNNKHTFLIISNCGITNKKQKTKKACWHGRPLLRQDRHTHSQ